jgi:1,4-dihydroxy-6-naphthoate synthase
MNLTIGFSPCPNDTFIFDAMVNRHIDCGDLEFEPVLEDVETLNRWALEGKLQVTKLSFPAFFRSTENYRLLSAGSALGKGVGPLLVSKEERLFSPDEIEQMTIGLPGANTTANLLFSYAFPGAQKKVFRLFSSIEDAVLNGECGVGVIIHENRFTYQEKGLHKQLDLGEYWERETGVAIPLGGIAIHRTVEEAIARRVDAMIRESLEWARARYPDISGYVKMHSQSMSEDVMRRHIDLYVNEYSLDLGEKGREAIDTLFDIYLANNASGKKSSDIFL